MLTTRRNLERFVILFPGRTGSSYLTSMLASHPDIDAQSEAIGWLRPRGADAQIEWANQFLRGPLLGRERVIGFKTKLRDVEDRQRFTEVLREHRPRLIFLTRENDVKHAVSRLNARRLHDATGHWNRQDGDGVLPPMHVEPDDFAHHLAKAVEEKADTTAFVNTLDLPCLVVSYEELTSDDGTLPRILTYIGATARPLTGATQKNTDDRLRQVVSNFDELRSHYVGTPYEAMFDE